MVSKASDAEASGNAATSAKSNGTRSEKLAAPSGPDAGRIPSDVAQPAVARKVEVLAPTASGRGAVNAPTASGRDAANVHAASEVAVANPHEAAGDPAPGATGPVDAVLLRAKDSEVGVAAPAVKAGSRPCER